LEWAFSHLETSVPRTNKSSKKITRAAFLFGRPQIEDPEISHIANVLGRDSDLIVETEAGKNTNEIHRLLQNSSGNSI
jgi:hypothetical protein